MDVVVVLAAGPSSRFGGTGSKVLLGLDDQSVLARAVQPYASIQDELAVFVSVHPDDRERVARLLPDVRLVTGGTSRQHSLSRAMRFLPPNIHVVLVQDASRPLTTPQLVRDVLRAARKDGAAAPIRHPPDPLVHVAFREGRRTPLVADTLPTADVGLAQSPVGIQTHILRAALLLAERDGLNAPDDVSLLRHAGVPVTAVPGLPFHPKIVRPSDLELTRAWVRGSRAP